MVRQMPVRRNLASIVGVQETLTSKVMSGESLELDDTITSLTWKKAYEGCRLDYPVSHGIDHSGKNKLPSSFFAAMRVIRMTSH